jgi:CubicO group peptidase (beta-lactamase class C family)
VTKRSFSPVPRLAILLLPLLLPPAGTAQTAAVAPDLAAHLRQYVPALLKDWQVPGVAIAVIQGDQVIAAEGFGRRDVDRGLPVTPDTVFAAGSATKAFTALALGMMVDEGKVAWDRPVRADLPDFRLSDTGATERVTLRDFLTHRSGLARHDLVWYGSSATRSDLIGRLAGLGLSADPRSRFQYQNLGYVVAAAVLEKAAGRRWEEVIRERLLTPLGMRASDLSVAEMQRLENHAGGYERREDRDGIQAVPPRDVEAVAPAIGLNSTVLDLAKWVQLQLGDGRFGGRRLVSEAALRETQTPQVVVREPNLTRLFLDESPAELRYGLGWYVQPYRGRTLLQHGGNIDGFTSFVSFLPRENLGVVVLSNLGESYLPYALAFHTYDRLLGLPERDWSRYYLDKRRELDAATERQRKADEEERKLGTRPSHPIDDYAGLYSHPAYGDLRVVRQGMGLGFSFNSLSGNLDHWHYDTWNLPSGRLRGLKLTFQANALGDIDRVSAPLEAGAPDVVFTRRPPAELSDPGQLRQYVGEYELSGQTATVALLGTDRLTLTVPGQPVYELTPYRGTIFNVNGLNGYSVRFIVEEGEVTAASFVQPTGVFRAVRRKGGR